MKSDLKDVSDIKKEISIEIPADEAEKEYQRTLQGYAQRAKIKGFRPGKVPQDVVKRMYHEDIRESVINSLVPKAVNDELRSYNLNPAGTPVVTELDYEEGQSIKLKAEFEVWPEIELPDYTQVKVKRKKASISQKEVEESLADIQTRSAQYLPVEGRGVSDGDYVVAEIKGQDVKTKRYLPTEKAVVLVNHPDNEKALNDNLIGLKINEEARFSVDYEPGHKNKKLAGKTIDYVVKVISIKEKTLPDINDDFAKDLGEFDDLKSLKDRIKKELKENKQEINKRELADEVVRKIVERTKFDLPESVVEQETTAVIRRQMASAPQQDIKPEDLEAMREEAQETAVRTIKNHLILNKIAEKEKLSVSEKDFQEEMNRLAQVNNVPVAQVIESINREGRKDELMGNLLLRRTVDFLVDKAIIE